MGEWALDPDTEELIRLGLQRAPVESTLRELFARIDAAGLDAALAVFAWCRVRHVAGRAAGLSRLMASPGAAPAAAPSPRAI